MNLTPFRSRVAPRAKTLGLSMTLWAFGLATSVLLIGLWGRSVADDRVTLEASTRAVLDSDLVNDRVTDWIGDVVAATGRYTSDESAALVDALQEAPELEGAVDTLVDQAVAAALAPPGTAATINVEEAVNAILPAVATRLEEQGVVANADELETAAHSIPWVVLSADDQSIVATTASDVHSALTKVVLVALAGMLATGAAAVLLSEDRLRQLRSLLTRIAISAFTFSIFLRIGGWAVDPAGGRSPVAAGGAVVLRSNGHVLATVALVGAATATTVTLFMRRRRRTGEPRAVEAS
jgi:hypothetical protein